VGGELGDETMYICDTILVLILVVKAVVLFLSVFAVIIIFLQFISLL